MKFLITGGAGFIGSFLCKKLLGLGCFVVCFDNLLRGKKENIASSPYMPLIQYIYVSLQTAYPYRLV